MHGRVRWLWRGTCCYCPSPLIPPLLPGLSSLPSTLSLTLQSGERQAKYETRIYDVVYIYIKVSLLFFTSSAPPRDYFYLFCGGRGAVRGGANHNIARKNLSLDRTPKPRLASASSHHFKVEATDRR